jgi:hypothetical protein
MVLVETLLVTEAERCSLAAMVHFGNGAFFKMYGEGHEWK